MEVLREKAKLLRESMQRSAALHRDAAVTVGSLSNHMAAIDDAMRPAQVPPKSSHCWPRFGALLC